MVDALVSVAMEQLASFVGREIEQEARLVSGVEREVKALTGKLDALKAVLEEAEKRRTTERVVQVWTDQLKDICYDIDDLLDDWRTRLLKSQAGRGVENEVPLRGTEVGCCFPLNGTSSSLNHLLFRRNIAMRIRDINRKLEAIAKDKDRYNLRSTTTTCVDENVTQRTTTSFIDESIIKGRDKDKEELVSKLVCKCVACQAKDGKVVGSGEKEIEEIRFRTIGEPEPASKREEKVCNEKGSPPSIFSIAGMGGIGKTTLAQLVYKDFKVKNHFGENQIWVCVSEPFDLSKIAKAIIEELGHCAHGIVQLQSLLKIVSTLIRDQKFLLILDDVWEEDYKRWEPLRNCLKENLQGSKILVTTRKERVSLMMETQCTINLESLSDEDCWTIFKNDAFMGRSGEECANLENTGRIIVNRCKGLPVAAKVLGGLMRFKSKQEWEGVMQSDLWDLEEAKKNIITPLWLSYFDLPAAMKQCFLYCAMFPKNFLLERNILTKLWMANGFLGHESSVDVEMELRGEEYFDSLAMRSLFQDFEYNKNGRIEKCKMHDMVHELAKLITRNESQCLYIGEGNDKEMEASHENVRHLACILQKKDNSSVTVHDINLKGLRTILVCHKGLYFPGKTLSNLLRNMNYLRALFLSRCDFYELPKEVGKLMHLRYLWIEACESLRRLPETVCDLINLQTLNIFWCFRLEALPRGIGNLANLRHLTIDDEPTRITKGIGRLQSLRTLSKYVVTPKEDEDGCKLGDLEKLNHLRGKLSIKCLGEVADAVEAKRACLKDKKNLHHLNLEFSTVGVADTEETEAAARRDFSVMEALEPPQDLEYLVIHFYRGTQMPNWILSLSKLKVLGLHDCANLEKLPDGFQKLQTRLIITECPCLKEGCRGENGVDRSLNSHIPPVFIDPKIPRLQEAWDPVFSDG